MSFQTVLIRANDRTTTATEVTLWPRPTTTEEEEEPFTFQTEPPIISRIPAPIDTNPPIISRIDPPTFSDEVITSTEMTTRTDSGRTVTVPNNNVVTVTRKTLIITDRLPTTSSTSSTSLTTSSIPSETPLPTPSESAADSQAPNDTSGNAFTTGSLVGVSVGGAAMIALIVMGVFWFKKRQKRSRDTHAASAPQDSGREDLVEEKHFPNMTPHTTGTTDPFAAFGGRADQSDSDYPTKPPENTFEMDGTSAAPVELPAPNRHVELDATETYHAAKDNVSPLTPTADPKATLNFLGTEEGQPKVVNHWNHYRAMSS